MSLDILGGVQNINDSLNENFDSKDDVKLFCLNCDDNQVNLTTSSLPIEFITKSDNTINEQPWTIVKSLKSTKINKQASQMVYLKSNDIKLITSTSKSIEQNTKKRYDIKVFENFLFTFASLCLKRKSSKLKWYLKELIHQLKNTEISSVEDNLNNVKYLNDNDNNNIKFSNLHW